MLRKLHWWDDDDRDFPLSPRHTRAIAERKERHAVNNLRERVEEEKASLSAPEAVAFA